MSQTYTPVILDPVLENDTFVSGFYPSGSPLQSVLTDLGNGTQDNFVQTPLGALTPGTFGLEVDSTTANGLTGYYYNDEPGHLGDFLQANFLLSKVDPRISDDQLGLYLPLGLNASGWFQVRWVGELQADYDETYTFTISATDGARLYVDGTLVINSFSVGGSHSGFLDLTVGRHEIQLDYNNMGSGPAAVTFEWNSTTQTGGADQPVPTDHLFPLERYVDDGASGDIVGNIILVSTGETVGTINYFDGSWDFTTPLGHIPPFHYVMTFTLTPVPKVAVLLDGIKLGEVAVESAGAITPNVLYDDGVPRDSWSWTFDVLAAYDQTFTFPGDGSQTTFSGDPGKAINPGTFSTVVVPTGDVYVDLPLDGDFGSIRFGDISGPAVGSIAYRAGRWTFTTSGGHTPPADSTVNVTMSFVPSDNAPTQINRRQRVVARARVLTYDWSDNSERVAKTQYFRQNLVNLVPPEFNYLDSRGDLASFIQVFAITLDELKDFIDAFVEVFDLDRCEAKYLPYIAQYLGYDLNRSDTVEFQRKQLKNAVAWYKVKGTFDSFKILFYSLGYQIRLYQLWADSSDPATEYKKFFTGLPANYRSYVGLPTYDLEADTVPDDDVRLIENSGTWYRTPHFAIELNSIATPNLTGEGLRYILARISKIRPAHTVLEYLKFIIRMEDTYEITDEEYHNTAIFDLEDEGWMLGYCVIGDPVYRRSGIDFPGYPGTFPTRNGIDAPAITLQRFQTPTFCNPPEDLLVQGIPTMTETYYLDLFRNGMGMVPASGPYDPDRIDHETFPWRGMSEPILRDGRYRYLNDLVLLTFGPIIGRAILTGAEAGTIVGQAILEGSQNDGDEATVTGQAILAIHQDENEQGEVEGIAILEGSQDQQQPAEIDGQAILAGTQNETQPAEIDGQAILTKTES